MLPKMLSAQHDYRRDGVMAVTLVARGNSIRDQVSAEEWAARVELAAGHRVLAHYGVNDLTYNHFGLRVPGESDAMLIKRTDWMFSEVTASSLLKVDFDGNVLTDTDVRTIKGGALIIHAGLLKARRDLNATLHTHTVAGMGVAAHKFGLLPINQHALRFYGEIKYHAFEGLEFDHAMAPKLVRDLEGGHYVILRNHGVLVCGNGVAACVVNHHFLEMACQGQIAALSAGEGNYTIPNKEACEYAHSQFMEGGSFLSGGKDWAACLRLAERLDPSYKD
jgi:ribulose-5-phosphate 4-epimerase/fuculose-1-phosphate aldolase